MSYIKVSRKGITFRKTHAKMMNYVFCGGKITFKNCKHWRNECHPFIVLEHDFTKKSIKMSFPPGITLPIKILKW